MHRSSSRPLSKRWMRGSCAGEQGVALVVFARARCPWRSRHVRRCGPRRGRPASSSHSLIAIDLAVLGDVALERDGSRAARGPAPPSARRRRHRRRRRRSARLRLRKTTRYIALDLARSGLTGQSAVNSATKRRAMSINSFGRLLRFTTWGESHGPALGAVVDGCPPGLALSEADLQPFLDARRPGANRSSPPSGRSPTRCASCRACSRAGPPARRSA